MTEAALRSLVRVLENPSKEYKLLHRIGHGGFSKVYLAKRLQVEPNSPSTVAIKISDLRADVRNSNTMEVEEEEEVPLFTRNQPQAERSRLAAKDIRESVLRELRALNALQGSDYIINCYESFVCNAGLLDEVWLVLERMAVDLERIHSCYQVDQELFWIVAGEVLRGLEFLQSRNIVHHDIKPANVMLSESGHVKIGDFGLSLEQGQEPLSVAYAWGTDEFMAPELFVEGEEYDYSVDVWSVGVLFFCLLNQGNSMFNLNPDLNQQEFVVTAKKEYLKEQEDYFTKVLTPGYLHKADRIAKYGVALSEEQHNEWDEVYNSTHHAFTILELCLVPKLGADKTKTTRERGTVNELLALDKGTNLLFSSPGLDSKRRAVVAQVAKVCSSALETRPISNQHLINI